MTDGLIIQEMKNRPGQNNRVIHDNRKDNKKMKELYEAIEAKIKASGYPRAISGEDVYNDICDQIDGKENGSYVLLSKFEDDVIFEYHITIQDEDFNLGILTMRTPEGVFETDFCYEENQQSFNYN